MRDDILHFACGRRRGNAPTTNGRTLQRFEDLARNHDSSSCAKCTAARPIDPNTDNYCQECGAHAADHQQQHGAPSSARNHA